MENLTTNNYDFSQFFDNGEYNNINWEKGVTNTSIPYSLNFDQQAKTYYTDWTGSGASDLENNFTPYTAFTNYVINGVKNKDKGVYKYLSWLLNKTSKDGVEGGAENLRIGTDLGNIWDATTGDFKVNLNWDDDAIKSSMENIINRYTARRKDGKFGWYHLGPKTVSDSSITVKKVPENDITIDSYTPYKAPEGTFKGASFKYPGWSDWLPLTADKIMQDLSALRTNKLDRLKVYPKQQAPYIHQEVTDAYAQNSLLEQQRNDVLNRAALMDGSDVNLNLRLRMQAEETAKKYTDLINNNRENEYNSTTQKQATVLDTNRQRGVEAANYNRQSDAVAWNNILSSRKQQILDLTKNASSWIRDMYTNFGDYLKTLRLNKDGLTKLNAYAKLKFDLQRAYDLYYKVSEDSTYWPGYNEMVKDLLESTSHDPAIGEFRDKVLKGELVQGTPEFKRAVDTLLASSQDSAVLKHKNALAAYLDQLLKQAQNATLQATNDYYQTIAGIPTFLTNQWGYPVNTSAFMKSGGKMDRFSDYALLIQRELESVRKTSESYHRRANAEYDKQTGRISKEELSLLMAIFK